VACRNYQGARRAFDGTPEQVSSARAFAREVLGPIPVLDEALLLLSELCTNALQHTASGSKGSFEVAIDPGPEVLRVEVRDSGAARAPALVPADPAAETGRGLALVAALAGNWGCTGDREGRVVFFELPL
jgi:anti-sigma regulatory factor (Ser/Thr protein kinase)